MAAPPRTALKASWAQEHIPVAPLPDSKPSMLAQRPATCSDEMFQKFCLGASTLNINGPEKLKCILKSGQLKDTHILCVQESKTCQDQTVRLVHFAETQGWKAFFTDCIVSKADDARY